MTTINAMQDFIRLLDENPEWRDELRSRLLSKELLELPDKFAQFVDEMRAFVARTEAFMETANRRFEQIERRLDAMDRRFEQIERRLDAMDRRLDQMDRRLDQMDRRLDAMDRRFDQIDNSLNRIRNDIGQVKAGHARNMAITDASLIASRMGFKRTRTLVMDDLLELVHANDVTDIPANHIDSFLRTDLIMEAKDSQGEKHYIAVEISYTVNGRDTRRAIRNADFLKRFTNYPVHAVVSGARYDDRVKEVIETNSVYWHQLPEKVLEVH